jgi:undecaprenyl-diphosphatase
MRPARFLWNRLTPGGLGLELTTLLALAGVGGFSFALLGDELGEHPLLPLDREALRAALRMHTGAGETVALAVTALGSFPAVAVAVLATMSWAAARQRAGDAAVLLAGALLTWALVRAAKLAWERPRPAEALYDAAGFAYPSGHAAQAITWVACAVVLARGGLRIGPGSAAVVAAILLAAAIAFTRVYLRVHYLSDVLGGLGLGTAIFAAVAILAVVVGFVRHNAPST